MRSPSFRASLLAIASVCALSEAALAQRMLSGTVLMGTAAGRSASNAPAPLVPGMRIASPRNSWVEVALSDGSSFVLEAGADLTIQRFSRDAKSGRWIVSAASSNGRVRVAMSDDAAAIISTGGAQVRIDASSAVVQSGAQGSVSLIAGKDVVVTHDGRDDVLHRPGFSVSFAAAGTRRDSDQTVVTELAAFAPVMPLSSTRGSIVASSADSASQAAQSQGSSSSGSRSQLQASTISSGSASSNVTTGSVRLTSVSVTPVIFNGANDPGQSAGQNKTSGTSASTGSGGAGASGLSGALALALGGALPTNSNISTGAPAPTLSPQTPGFRPASALPRLQLVSLSQTYPQAYSSVQPVVGTVTQFLVVTSDGPFIPSNAFSSSAVAGDTGLLVIAGTQPSNSIQRVPLLRTNLQILSSGTAVAAVTAGGVTSDGTGLVLNGRTYGSAQYPGQSPFAIVSDLKSGLLSIPPAAVTATNLSPVSVTQLGASTSPSSYSLSLPLQAATSSSYNGVNIPGGAAPSLNLQGYSSAVVQTARNGAVSVSALSSRGLGDMSTAQSNNAGEFTASFVNATSNVGTLPGTAAPVSQVLSFGTQTSFPPSSAAVITSPTLSNPYYGVTVAALGAGMAMASVDANVLQGIQGNSGNVTIPGTNTTVTTGLPPSNEHLAWGFFLGSPSGGTIGATGDYIGLGFWTAGIPVGSLQTLQGNATYAGGMIGTAVNASGSGSVTTQVGQFAQNWNFSNHSGQLSAAFDKAGWQAVQLGLTGSSAYAGGGTSISGDRTLTVQGSFFNRTPLASGLPAATGGQFSISGPNYGANGILVGTRR